MLPTLSHCLPDRHRNPHRTALAAFAVAAFAVAVVLALALPAAAQVVSQQPYAMPTYCVATVDPIPSGTTQEPGDTFNTQPDYRWVHSGTHLQGTRAYDKWAWGFFLPKTTSPAPLFNQFRTVVVVNNPDATAPITVLITYRDMNGMTVGTSTRTIPGNGTVWELASPLATGTGNGLGTIEVASQPGSGPFVGATVHHSYRFNGVLDNEPLAPFDAQHPGLASMQQLQDPDSGATRILAGPFPTTSTAAATHVFLKGNLPTFQVINPNSAVNNVQITFYGSISGTVVGPINVALPAYGSHIDMTLLNALYNPATNAYFTPIHDDWLVQVVSTDGLPLLGEQLMLDFYDSSLSPFTRFRMVSAMMATQPALTLYDPELTYESSGPAVHTISAIGNASGVDIGPVVIEYRDPRTGYFASDVLASFPSGASQRIAPGEPNITNYPNPVFDGTIRVRACKPGLIGWTAREVEVGLSGGQQFRKAYGESLDGDNKSEPGTNFPVSTLGLNLRRKVAPLDRCALSGDFPNYWPAYTAVTNFSVANVGSYYYQFFEPSGLQATDFTLQPIGIGFAGIRFAEDSFTFEDGLPNRVCLPAFSRETSGRVDVTTGSVKGIDVIGDPLYEWNLGLPNPPVYGGPGDVVPHETTTTTGGTSP